MQNLLSEAIRKKFEDFFSKKNHKILKSSPLVLLDDPSILFVNAGMVPLKDYFIFGRKDASKNLCSVQKCLRAGGKHNDLENVGFSKRHHTFFEMLGNFSFGGYFKEEAICYAWDFITKELNIDPQRLYITYHSSDKETSKLWRKISGLKEDRIIAVSTNDNFWQMGNTGPCGPCTEIFYDHQNDESIQFLKDSRSDDRFVEIWNIVFMQYNLTEDGKRENIKTPCIDTGMGLERIAAVLQGTDDNFETDLFKDIKDYFEDITSCKYNNQVKNIVADHLRSSCFLISEGIYPSGKSRGYILRKIIRRAVSNYYINGIKEPILYKMVDFFVKKISSRYPELEDQKENIKKVLKAEETLFLATMGRSMQFIMEIIDKEKKRYPNISSTTEDRAVDDIDGNSSTPFFPSAAAFNLYDTHGMPFEVIKETIHNFGFSVSEKEFLEEMEKQKERGRKSWKKISHDNSFYEDISELQTKFIGYISLDTKTEILNIRKKEDDLFEVVLKETPFYPESGGQESDTGTISCIDDSCDLMHVLYSKKINDVILITCKLERGVFKEGQKVFAKVDYSRRRGLCNAHSATHLLHYFIRELFGKHITQKGSLVSNNKFRFDFNFERPFTRKELTEIEHLINNTISQNITSKTQTMSTEEAVKSGAMSIFGEKYQEESRVVSIGDSVELCGGMHVYNTSEIGVLKITDERSISSGIRRIEAVTGLGVISYFDTKIETLDEKLSDEEKKRLQLLADLDKLKNELIKIKLDNISLEPFFISQKFKFVINSLDYIEHSKIRNFVTNFSRDKKDSVLIFVSSSNNKKIVIICCGDDAAKIFKASEIIKFITSKYSTGGGGSDKIAQTSNISIDENSLKDDIKFYLENHQIS
ncbi:alanine--tRNA ligase [Anaplasmataceae bacterium AB001_6]|nr:alanine--tRNA ligase [Anaplasmataceae bacterium AB001_6]